MLIFSKQVFLFLLSQNAPSKPPKHLQNAPSKPYHDLFFSNCIRLVNQKGSRFRTQSSKTSNIFYESVAFCYLDRFHVQMILIQLIHSKVFSTCCNKT